MSQTVDWDQLRKAMAARGSGPKEWPSHVRPISLTGVNFLGLDDNGQLYWDGKLIKTEVRLSILQNVGVAITVLSAIVAAIATAVQAYVAWHTCLTC